VEKIFREAWRYQRDYFYVKNVHGLDMDWAFKTYSSWIDHVKHRSDLTYVLDIFEEKLPLALLRWRTILKWIR
jgi:tricorn protease